MLLSCETGGGCIGGNDVGCTVVLEGDEPRFLEGCAACEIRETRGREASAL